MEETKRGISTARTIWNQAAPFSTDSSPFFIMQRFALVHNHRITSYEMDPPTTFPRHHSYCSVRYFSTTLLIQQQSSTTTKAAPASAATINTTKNKWNHGTAGKKTQRDHASTQPPESSKSSKRLPPAEQRRRRRARLIKRQKRLRREQQQQQGESAASPPQPPFGPKRTESEMKALFEELARNYPVSQVKEVLGKLEQQMDSIHQASNDPTNNQKKKENSSRKATVFSHAAHIRNLLYTANPNNPLQIRLLEFLLRTTRPPSKRQQKRLQQQQQQQQQQSSPSPNSTTPTAMAASQREDFLPGAVESLMQARFFYHQQQKEQQQQQAHQQSGPNESSTLVVINADFVRDDSTVSEYDQTATEHREHHVQEETEAKLLLEFLIESVPPKTLVSVMEVFQYLVQKMKEKRQAAINGEQRRDDITLANHPEDDHEMVTSSNKSSEENDSETRDRRKKKKWKKREENLLYRLHRHLKRRSGPHYALFAERVTLFFDSGRPETTPALMVHADNPRLAKAKLDWDAYRQSFCRKLMTIQEKMDLRPKVEKMDDQPENHAFSVNVDRYEDELIVEELVDSESGSETNDQDENAVNDSLNELEHDLNLSSLSKNSEKKTKKAWGMHAVFEAIIHKELPLSPSSAATQISPTSKDSLDTAIIPPPAHTTVFLENLPIDMTELRLTELYSRCGDIASVQIFNQRPDLDPGPLSALQIRERRRQHVRSISMRRKRRWNPPRSPVYGLITFENEQGYGRCINDTLRIFGMLVEKHPVRSIKASDMKKLFIESIPVGELTSADFETMLCHVLQPNISLNSDFAGMSSSSHQRRKSIHSCEIKFPSFEIAFQCYHKLMLDLDLIRNVDDCAVQWMRTPRDAELWWTRKRGFG